MRMIGYANNGYKLWNPKTDEIIVSRDVRFDENNTRYKPDNETTFKNIVIAEDCDYRK